MQLCLAASQRVAPQATLPRVWPGTARRSVSVAASSAGGSELTGGGVESFGRGSCRATAVAVGGAMVTSFAGESDAGWRAPELWQARPRRAGPSARAALRISRRPGFQEL